MFCAAMVAQGGKRKKNLKSILWLKIKKKKKILDFHIQTSQCKKSFSDLEKLQGEHEILETMRDWPGRRSVAYSRTAAVFWRKQVGLNRKWSVGGPPSAQGPLTYSIYCNS